jgi:hypothetical protein
MTPDLTTEYYLAGWTTSAIVPLYQLAGKWNVELAELLAEIEAGNLEESQSSASDGTYIELGEAIRYEREKYGDRALFAFVWDLLVPDEVKRYLKDAKAVPEWL